MREKMHLLKSGLLALLFSLAIVHPGAQSQVDDEKKWLANWNTTNLSNTSVVKLVNGVDCSENHHILACVNFLTLLAEASPAHLVLAADPEIALNPELQTKPVQDFGVFKLIKPGNVQRLKLSVAQALELNQKRLHERANSYGTLAKNLSHSSQKIDWVAIAHAVLALYPTDQPMTKALIGEAINDYLSTLYDPHTHIMPTIQSQEDNEDHHNFGGVGLAVNWRLGRTRVIDIIPDSPAAKSTAQLGDYVISVDGLKVDQMPLDEVVGHIRGEVGTTTHLTLSREPVGQPHQLIELTLQRAIVEQADVQSKMITHDGVDLAWIQLRNFSSDQACADIANEVQTRKNQGARGFILDLRNNPGGKLDQAVCIGMLFTGANRTIVNERQIVAPDGTASVERTAYFGQVKGNVTGVLFAHIDTQGEQTFGLTNKFPFAPSILPINGLYPVDLHVHATLVGQDLPVVVLVNAGSASASEIVAGALQDYGAINQRNFWVAGERTFGKATVQRNRPSAKVIPEVQLLADDFKGIEVFYTMARFYLPSMRTTQDRGVIPDFAIAQVPHPTADDWQAFREENESINAYPPVGDPWTQPRPDDIRWIQSCADRDLGSIEKTFNNEMATVGFSDYQKMVAESLVACLAPSKAP